MQLSNLPAWVAKVFAQDATGSYVRAVPVTTTDPGAASHALGFPPQTFTAEGAGGTPPDGRDVNGVLNYLAAWARWQGAGGSVTFSAAVASAGGYPKGAVVLSASVAGLFFVSTADDNTTNPESGGAANWLPMGAASSGSSASGYWEKRPDGIMEQWGTGVANDPWSGALSFPQPFIDTASINLQATARDNNSPATNGNKVAVDWLSASTYRLGSDDGNVNVFWRAVGRWY